MTGGANSLGPQLAAAKKRRGRLWNSQAGLALGLLLGAQPIAARQDLLIGKELIAMRLANQSLEQRLAMDVQFVRSDQ